MRHFLRVVLALLLAFLALFGIFVWPSLQQAWAWKRLELMLEPGCKPTYTAQPQPKVEAALRWLDGKMTGNARYKTYRERYAMYFTGPIVTVRVYEFRGFSGDLGSQIAHFPKLQELQFCESRGDLPTEADLTMFCARLREISDLKKVELCGWHLTDDAIVKLAGHPSLESVTICYSSLSPACAPTFASMPRLKYLRVVRLPRAWRAETKEALRLALPASVKLETP